jgi:hypothetical protein
LLFFKGSLAQFGIDKLHFVITGTTQKMGQSGSRKGKKTHGLDISLRRKNVGKNGFPGLKLSLSNHID